MKKQIFIASLLSFALISSAQAGMKMPEDVSGVNNSKGSEQSQQGQNGNASVNNASMGQEQSQQQIQEQLQIDPVQNKNSNQVKNQGEDFQIQNQAQEQEQEMVQQNNSNNTNPSEQRRSRVANAVQEMINVAERNEGIGSQIRVIAQNQNQNQEKIEESLQKVQGRNTFAKIFIGPNYGEINNARKTIEESKIQIENLEEMKSNIIDEEDLQIIEEQIENLKQYYSQTEELLKTSERGFSLFGWLNRMLSR